MGESAASTEDLERRLRTLERKLGFCERWTPRAIAALGLFGLVWGSIFDYARHKSLRIEDERTRGAGVVYVQGDGISLYDDEDELTSRRVFLTRNRLELQDSVRGLVVGLEEGGATFRARVDPAAGRPDPMGSTLVLGATPDGVPSLRLLSSAGRVVWSAP